MDDKDINRNSDGKPITDIMDNLFDDFFASIESDEGPDSKKENPIPEAPPGKPDQQKIIPKKERSTPDNPSVKPDTQKIATKKSLNKKSIPSGQSAKNKPALKKDVITAEKKPSYEGRGKTALQNVFKKANQKYKKNELWSKVKKCLKPVIFTLLISLLVILSMFTGKVMDYDGVLKFFHMTNPSTSVPENFSTTNKNVKKVSVSKNIETPPPVDVSGNIKTPFPKKGLVESKIVKRDIQGSDRNNDEDENQITTDTILLEKSADEIPDVIKQEIMSHPYSIYLGSYNSLTGVKQASSDYMKMGITSYWIKIDLGKKGIWFRLFAGYFQTREDADEFIKTRQIKEARSRLTRYANLIGTYRSEEDMEKKKTYLEELGYSPYIINDTDDSYRLYTGAFYQKSRAEEQKKDLIFNGIKSEVVER